MSRCRSNSRKARLVKFNAVVWRFVINNSSEALEGKKIGEVSTEKELRRTTF